MRITPHVLSGISLVLLTAAVQIGCSASGVEDEMTTADLKATPIETGENEGESVTLPPSNPPKEQPQEENAAAGDPDAGTADAGGGNNGGNNGGGNNGGGTTASCAATNTCMGATDLGMVSGDQGADVIKVEPTVGGDLTRFTGVPFGGTIDYLVEAVCNYPTLAEGYKVAALDAANKIATLARMSG